MDEKFEHALEEVASSIDQYVGIVNDTSSKQYDDFNQNIKKAFGASLQQIQDVITNLNEELEASKEKAVKMEKEMNEVDFNAKKRNEEVKDKMEVERCVIEMVSWVSEQLQNQQYNDKLQQVYKAATTANIRSPKPVSQK